MYGCLGRAKIAPASPVSTNVPAYITFTRSHMPATTPRSWVIMISAVPSSRTSVFSRSRICAWMVTSSAVVGSSAIRARLACECHRDHRPLTHPARELVRVILQPRSRAGNAHLIQQLRRPDVRRLPIHVEVTFEHLANLLPDREHRVEARHRVLEDHRDLLAPDPAEVSVGQLEQVAALEPRRPRRHLAGAGKDAEECQRRNALATAGFPHDPERLPGSDVERDAVHCVDRSAIRPELDTEIVDAEESLRHGPGASDRGPRACRLRSG